MGPWVFSWDVLGSLYYSEVVADRSTPAPLDATRLSARGALTLSRGRSQAGSERARTLSLSASQAGRQDEAPNILLTR